MTSSRKPHVAGIITGLCALSASAGLALAQAGSTLPPIAPTSTTAPLAAVATSADRAGGPHHHAQVNCTGGQLEVRADNSSLNGILRAIARCTGMKVTGGVVDQRVFGVYGPAAPATVLATLLDGTNSNMLLKETASAQPAELILTPRTGGPTPPSPNQVPDDDLETGTAAPQAQPAPGQPMPNQSPRMGYANAQSQPAPAPNPNQTPVLPPIQGSIVTSPPSMPPTTNNVMGSPSNTSPTASTYPTTNSVPLDTLPTPSTTPSPNGIVDAPNPPAPGSDTAKMMNGTSTNVPGATNITDQPTSNASSPGGTNTSTPVPGGTAATAPGTSSTTTPGTGALTPEQVYQQLQKMQQQQHPQPNQTQQPGNQQQSAPSNGTPQ